MHRSNKETKLLSVANRILNNTPHESYCMSEPSLEPEMSDEWGFGRERAKMLMQKKQK